MSKHPTLLCFATLMVVTSNAAAALHDPYHFDSHLFGGVQYRDDYGQSYVHHSQTYDRPTSRFNHSFDGDRYNYRNYPQR